LNRCKRCGAPLTEASGVIASVSALLDMEVPRPRPIVVPACADPILARLLDCEARMRAALAAATDALAIEHGYCRKACALVAPVAGKSVAA
jgi:hypothetical protein